MRVQVFDGAVRGAALPFPSLRAFFPIAAVALPEGDMAPAQAILPNIVPAHQRRRFAAGIGHLEFSGYCFSIIADGGDGKIGDILTLGIDAANLVSA